MAKYLLKQPNGKFAAFSSIVDDIVVFDMTEAEALEYGVEEWGRHTAEQKLARAVADEAIEGDDTATDGLRRWRETIDTIALLKGVDGLKATLAEMHLSDYEIPQSTLELASQSDED